MRQALVVLILIIAFQAVHAVEQIRTRDDGSGPQADRVLRSFTLGMKAKYPDNFDHFDYVDPKAPKGGTFSMGSWNQGWNTLNPFVAGTVPIPGSEWTHESLMTSAADDEASLYPRVASTLQVAKDGSYVIFDLNEKAEWNDPKNDGCDPKNPPKRKPITADDVAYSFDQQKKLGWGGVAGMYSGVKSYEILGDRRIIFHLKPDEHRGTIMALGRMSLVSKAQLDQPDKGFRRNPHEAAIGSGPYILDTAERLKVTYKRVCNHWGAKLPANKGRYNFDRVEYMLHDEYEQRDADFRNGKIDYIYEGRTNRWPPESWLDSKLMEQIKTGEVTTHEVDFKGTKEFSGIALKTENGALSDRHVRKALANMYEAEFVKDTLHGGKVTLTNSYFPGQSTNEPDADVDRLLKDLRKKHSDHVPEEVLKSVDAWTPSSDDKNVIRHERKARAIAEMKRAGWEVDPKTLKWMKDGKEFPVLNWPDYGISNQVFIDQVNKFGVPLRAKSVDWSLLTNIKKQNDYDLIKSDIYHREIPGAELGGFWSSESALHPASSRNLARLKNPAVDELVKKATNAQSAREQQIAVRALDRLLQAEVPLILLPHRPAYNYMVRKKIGHGYELPKAGKLEMYGLGMDSWYDKSAAP